MLKKKGQETAVNATYLILVIALLIVAYILLLPESEKEKFAGPPTELVTPPAKESPIFRSGFRVLLTESPGILHPPIDEVFTKPLASVNLFSTVESKLESITSTITVSSSLFGTEEKKVTFRINEQDTIASASLLLFTSDTENRIMIKLNGNEVFNDLPAATNLPIQLPISQLRATNTLEFSVEKPRLFGTNKAILRNVQLNLKVLRENNREARTFILNRAEQATLQGLTLYYVVNCFTVQENGRLLIRLNSQIISDNLIVCDAGEVSLDLPPQDILEGRNILEFEIDRGRYVLERVLIEGSTGQRRIQNYFFTVQLQDIQILNAGARVFLEMQFRNDGLRKIGTIFINGFPVYIDAFSDRFDIEVTDFITDGRNVLRIIPSVPFDVINMNVVLG